MLATRAFANTRVLVQMTLLVSLWCPHTMLGISWYLLGTCPRFTTMESELIILHLLATNENMLFPSLPRSKVTLSL